MLIIYGGAKLWKSRLGSRGPVDGAVPFGKSASQLKPEEAKQHPFRRLDDEQVKKLIDRTQKVKIGSTVNEVAEIMGNPDEDKTLYRPRLYGASEFRFRSLTYYAMKQDLLTPNTNDLYVMFVFDSSGGLEAVRSNISRLDSRGDVK
jgi:hypothetical protein